MSVIRGTQLFSHTIRMCGQSFKDWLRWASIMWVVVLIMITYYHVDDIHISHIKAELQSGWYNISGNKNRLIALIDREKKSISYYRANHIRNAKLTQKEIRDLVNILLKVSWQSLCIGIVLASSIFIFATRSGSKTRKSNFVRGREVITSQELNKLIMQRNKREKVNSYSVAGISYPARGEMEHLMLSGVTGTGKTVILRNLIKQIKERGDKAIIYDYTGAFVEGYYNPDIDILINPFDARSSSWCLLKEVDMEAEFETIAEALIGNSDSISDPFWPNGARLIFSELCKIQYKNGNFRTQDLYRYISLPPEELNHILSGTLARNFTNPKSDRTTLSLLMLMTTYLKGLQYIDNDGKNDFSIKKWILNTDERNMLFLSSRASLHGTIQPLISAMMDIAINNLGELPVGNKQKTWVIFDELASLNYLPSLEKGLTVSRNFGGCFVIALQSISQLVKRYGVQDAAMISSNCGSKIILKAGNNETARWASQLLGTQEIEEYREGLSYGAHEAKDGVNLTKNRSERSIALASEILSLPKLQGYAAMTGGFPVAKIDFEKLKDEKSLFTNDSFIKKINDDSEGK
jgi:type IV conjugative transfer system coupling protein TraD